MVALSPLLLLLPASAQIAAGMGSLQSFFQAYPTFSLALALMVVTVVFAKTALGAENNAIAAGLGVAVLIGVLVGVPETTARQYVNYILWIVIGGIFLGVVVKLLKGAGEGLGGLDIRWKLFFGSLGFFLTAIALSHLGLHQIAGVIYFFAIAFFVFFAIAAIAAGAGKLGGVKLRKGRKEEEGEEETSEVAEEVEEEAKEKRKARKKLSKEIRKFVDIKEKEILKPLERLKELLEDRVTLYQIEIKEDTRLTSFFEQLLKFLNAFEDFLLHLRGIERAYGETYLRLDKIRREITKLTREWYAFVDLWQSLPEETKKQVENYYINQLFVGSSELPKFAFYHETARGGYEKEWEHNLINHLMKYLYSKQTNLGSVYLGLSKESVRRWVVFVEDQKKKLNSYVNTLGFKIKRNRIVWAGKKVKKWALKVRRPGRLLEWVRGRVGDWIAKHATYADILDQLERKQDAYKKIIKEFGKVLNRLHVNIKFLIDLQSDIALVMDRAKEQGIEVDERKIRAAIRKAIVEEANVIYTIFKILGDRLGKEELEKIADKDFNAIIRLEKFGEQIKDDKKLLEILKRLHIFDRAEIVHVQRAFSEGIFKLSQYQLSWLEGAAMALVRAKSAMEEATKTAEVGRREKLIKEAEDARREAEKMIDKLYASIAHEMDIWLNLDRYVEHFERLARKEDYIFKRILPWVDKIGEEAKEEEKKEKKVEEKIEEEVKKAEKKLKKAEKIGMGAFSKKKISTISVPSFLIMFLNTKEPEEAFKKKVLQPLEEVYNSVETLGRDIFQAAKETGAWKKKETELLKHVEDFKRHFLEMRRFISQRILGPKTLSTIRRELEEAGIVEKGKPIDAKNKKFGDFLKAKNYEHLFSYFLNEYKTLFEKFYLIRSVINKIIEGYST